MDPVRRARDLGRRYLDGLASLAERSELEQVLRESPAAADAFAHLSRLEADLSALFSEEPGRLREAELLQGIERDQRRRRWRGRGLRLALAASLMLLLCGPLLWWLGQPSPPVSPPQANNSVLEGRVLVAGQAVERFVDGARLLVAGPESALLQLPDGSRARLRPGSRAVLYGRSPGLAQRVELIEGEGRFTVQRGEEAFRVDTSLGWVTALGTEFTVKLMKPDRGDPRMTMQRTLLAVIVFAGLVQVETEDGSQLLGVGENRVFGQERRAEPGGREGRRPAMFRAAVVEVKDGKLIIAVGRRDGASQEETLEIAATAKIFVDDKPAKLTDLVKRTIVTYTKDEQGAVTSIRAVGPLVGGTVKSVADGKVTLAGRGREAGDDKTYTAAKDVKVLLGRRMAKLEDVKEGMVVALQLSVDGKTVREIRQAQPRGAGAVRGVLTNFDAKAGTITLTGGRRGDDQTITLPKEVKVTIDGKPGKLEDLVKGAIVAIEKDDKGATTSVQAMGPTVAGVLKAFADGKVTLAGRGREAAEDKTYVVANDLKVVLGRDWDLRAGVKELMPVVLQLSVDGKTVLEIRSAEQGRSGVRGGRDNRVQGVIKEIDAKAGTITFPGGRGGDDQTITLPKEVKVSIDGKPAKVADLVKGAIVVIEKDEQGAATAVHASGPMIRGVVKSAGAGKVTLEPAGRRETQGKTYTVAKDVKAVIDGKPAKLEEFKEGAQVVLKLSMDGMTVLEISPVPQRGERGRERPGQPADGERKERPAAPPGQGREERPAASASTVGGEIKAVDAKSGTITLPAVRDSEDDRTFTLANEVKVTIDGESAKVANLKVGSKASLKLDRDGKTVVEIIVGGEKRR